MISGKVLNNVFKTYRLISMNHYAKLYKSALARNTPLTKLNRSAPRRGYLTKSYYENCGKYLPHCVMGDGRIGFDFPDQTFEETIDTIVEWTLGLKLHIAVSILKRCKNPSQENMIKILGLSEDYEADFEMIMCKYWLLTYDLNSVFKMVFEQGIPITPFISVAHRYNIITFTTYSVLAYRWNDINSYALEKFIKEYQDKYIPFTEITHIEYFFNCMTELLQEAFLYYRSLDTEDVWGEVYRLSWNPSLEYTVTPYDSYLEAWSKSRIEYTYIDGFEPRTSLDLI